MDIVKYNKPEPPLVWDYDTSIKFVSQTIYKWKTMSEEIAKELYNARRELSKPGTRTDLTPDQKSRGWTKYCEDIGSSKGVVNKWLKQWFETAHVSHNSGENEWYTPPQYIESARAVMGSIDLDPASSYVANQTVMATEFYTEDDDGITKDWYGNIWLNPPYSQPQISQFSDAVIAKRNQFESAIILVNNATETQWLQQMLNICDAACFVHGRIKFINVNGVASGAPLQGQCILYFGENVDVFTTHFKGFGICMKRA